MRQISLFSTPRSEFLPAQVARARNPRLARPPLPAHLAEVEAATRAKEGLPQGAFVYAHFNTLRKVDSLVFSMWMRILRATDASVLWLLRMPPAAEPALRAAAASAGVDAARLIFGDPLPAAAHTARCGIADLFVDSLHYGAHTTATDALYAGVPLLSLVSSWGAWAGGKGGRLIERSTIQLPFPRSLQPGKQFQARVAASLAIAAGSPELLVSTEEEYVELAVQLRGQA